MILIPSNKVILLYFVNLKSRKGDRSLGVDNTCYDLANVLRIALTFGKEYRLFSDSPNDLNEIIDGKVELDDNRVKWYDKNSYPEIIYWIMAEEIKRLTIMAQF